MSNLNSPDSPGQQRWAGAELREEHGEPVLYGLDQRLGGGPRLKIVGQASGGTEGERVENVTLTGNLPSSAEEELTRVSFELTQKDLARLAAMAANHGWTDNEAVRRSIATAAWLDSEARKGIKVLLRDPRGKTREAIFER